MITIKESPKGVLKVISDTTNEKEVIFWSYAFQRLEGYSMSLPPESLKLVVMFWALAHNLGKIGQ